MDQLIKIWKLWLWHSLQFQLLCFTKVWKSLLVKCPLLSMIKWSLIKQDKQKYVMISEVYISHTSLEERIYERWFSRRRSWDTVPLVFEVLLSRCSDSLPSQWQIQSSSLHQTHSYMGLTLFEVPTGPGVHSPKVTYRPAVKSSFLDSGRQTQLVFAVGVAVGRGRF